VLKHEIKPLKWGGREAHGNPPKGRHHHGIAQIKEQPKNGEGGRLYAGIRVIHRTANEKKEEGKLLCGAAFHHHGGGEALGGCGGADASR